MNITRVIIDNFLTIQHAEIELDSRGLLLIQGENKDDTSADSNGAGKSSIADAICWGLYGVTARGVSTDAVVNKTAKKDCKVEVWLSDGTDEWRIVRHRKDSTNKNATLVYQKHPTPGTMPIELHKGTERETQEVVNGIVGCSLDVFQAAVYAGQEKMPDLPAMTDKQLKLMIEEAAGTEVLAKAHQIARDKLNEALKAQASLDTLMASHAVQHTAAVSRLSDETVKHADYEAQRKPNAKAELNKVFPLQHKILELGGKIDAEELKDRGKELLAIAAQFAAIRTEQDQWKKLSDVATQCEKDVSTATAVARIEKNAYIAAQEALKTIEDKVGQPCDECGKAYCEHDIEAARKLRQSDVEKAKARAVAAAEQLKKALAAREAAQDAAKTFGEKMTDASALAARQRTLQAELDAVSNMKAEKARLESEVEKCKTAAGVWLKNDNPYTSSKALMEKTLKELEDKINKAHHAKKEIEEKVALLQDAVSVYGPAGVRAHILDTVTPYLNDRTSHYLSSLADDNIHAVWNTLTTNAKGEVKEKFQIEVTNDKGAESFDGLSGGEKRKVRLACAMALQDMVASRATKPINIFIADEVDHALDESGLERLMTVMNEKAKERGTVLVISHNSLSDWIDEVITVTKEKGYGKVSGATCKS